MRFLGSSDDNETPAFTGGQPAPAEPRVLKRQPKPAASQVVTQVTSTNGTTFDICARCSHMTTKLITNQTTCQCCKNGHPA